MQKLLNKDFIIYTGKCIVGFFMTYALYVAFPQHQFFWSVISVLLSFSPDDKGSRQVAYDRMKANILGSVLGIIIFMIHLPNVFLMALGVLFTILIATALNIQSTTRSALAAVIIVLLYEKENSSLQYAFERMICVIIGCMVALLLTLLCDILFYKEKRRRYARKAKVVTEHYLKDKHIHDSGENDTAD
ncbi:MAG TPA: FUSC family protein [Arachidicoccus sp.]